jgi:hypothetical protein
MLLISRQFSDWRQGDRTAAVQEIGVEAADLENDISSRVRHPKQRYD